MLPQNDTCTGCGNCAQACPIQCITMTADKEGFRYPKTDGQRCIHCGKCESACPVLKKPCVSGRVEAVAAQNRDDQIRSRSSSGGVFYALAKDVLSRGGKVCAAIYDADFSVRHVMAETEEQLLPMCGAKYAQSNAEHCFKPIKNCLTKNIPVMFVGTPCQCAALRNNLGEKCEGLLLVDMVCHGVPSPAVWQDYVQERKKLDAPRSTLTAVNLRSKESGWSYYGYSTAFVYENGARYAVPQGQNAFSRGFTSNLFLRPSCGNCVFKGAARCSDLTLGDYWGVWEQHPDFDDNKGTSLLLIQSGKGMEAWKCISQQFRWIPVSLQQALAQNPSAEQSSVPHPARETFFAQRQKQKSLEKWIWTCILPREESLLKRCIRKIFRKRG